MTELWQCSLVCRLLTWLAVWLRSGPVGRMSRRFKQLCAQSATARLLSRAFDREDPADSSCLSARLNRLHAAASRRGRSLASCVQASFLYRVYAAVLRALRNSLLLGRIFEDGLTGLILFGVGIYGVLDYLLRNVFAIPVFSSVWDELFLLGALAFVLYRYFTAEKPLRSRLNSMDLPVAAFLLIGAALLYCVHPFPTVGIAGYRATMQYLLWFFVLTRLISSERELRLLLHTLVAAATVIALHGIYQYIIGVPIPESWTDAAEGAVRTRVFSIFGSPNIMGDFLVLFAPLAVGLAYDARDTRTKCLLWGCALCMCLACLFTMSRGAWVGLVVAVVLFAILVDRRLLVLTLLAAILALFIPFVASRLSYLFSSQYAASAARGGRSIRWMTALSYLRSGNAWFGVGFGMFGGAIAMQYQPIASLEYFYVDNYYMKILTENGYIGLCCFLLMMLSLLLVGLRTCTRNKQTGRRATSAGLLAGLSGVLVHCYFENIFEEPYMMVYFWAVAAALVYLGFSHKAPDEAAHSEDARV